MVFEFVRWINAVRHTANYMEHAGTSDHHSLSEVVTHAAETYAGMRRYSRRTHEAKWRIFTLPLWFRRTSHHHPKNRG